MELGEVFFLLYSVCVVSCGADVRGDLPGFGERAGGNAAVFCPEALEYNLPSNTSVCAH